MKYSTCRIVMVDDDKDDLFLTKISFRRAPYPVDFVGLGSGKSLLEYIKFHGIGSIDVLLLDINMPVYSGYDILAELKKYPHFSDIKVIMFSTSNKRDEKSKALKSGAKNFMVKPSTENEIHDFIHRVGEHLNIVSLALA